MLIATAGIYDCLLLMVVYEVETSSLKGIGKVCKGELGEFAFYHGDTEARRTPNAGQSLFYDYGDHCEILTGGGERGQT